MLKQKKKAKINLFDSCVKCGSQGKLFLIDNQIICKKCLEKEKRLDKKLHAPNKKSWNELVTPKNFEQYIGQETIKDELKTMLKATEKHGIPVQHTLFSGSFGLGKTTIAKIFADMIGEWDIVTAVNIRDMERDFPKTPVVVVDEVHTIRDEEWLLGVMDRSNQTILGATTTAGSLSGPLRSRFVSLVLEPYTVNELKKMVLGASHNLKYDCPDFVAQEVAQRGKTVARIALFLFKRIYDRAILKEAEISPELLHKWFEEMKIDPDGLDNADRAYISCLSEKPIGLQNLSAITGLDRITIEETVEPYLLTKGFVKRTPRGRIKGDRKPLGVWA